MIRLPDVVGMVLCDRLDFQTFPGQAALVGIFHALRFRTFPTARQRFTVYCVLFDGIGEGTMELVISEAAGQDVHRLQRWFRFGERLQVVNLEIKVHSCIFPVPGQYLFVLKFDGRELSHSYLHVYQEA